MTRHSESPNSARVRKSIAGFLLVGLAMPTLVQAGHIHPERWYQNKWCGARTAQIEVVLSDGTRADCILPAGYALEVDFASEGKNFEAVGQALRYSRLTGLKPAILLIVEKQSDQRHVDGTKADLKYHGLDVKVWTIRP